MGNGERRQHQSIRWASKKKTDHKSNTDKMYEENKNDE